MEIEADWQDVLFKVIAFVSSVGILLLFCVAGLALLNPSAVDSSATVAKPIVYSATCVLLVLILGLYWERDFLGSRFPKGTTKICRVEFNRTTVLLLFPAILIVCLIVPMLNVGFLLAVGAVVLLWIGTLSTLERRLRGVAVCDAVLGLLVVGVFLRGGAWFPGHGQTSAALLGTYASMVPLLPLSVLLASFLFAPLIARISSITYMLMAFHAGAVAIVSVGVYMDEAVLDIARKFTGTNCMPEDAVRSPLEFLIDGIKTWQKPKEYTGPPATDPIPPMCIPVVKQELAAAEKGEGAVEGMPGLEVVVFFVLAALYLWALLASCAIFPPPIRVFPEQSGSGSPRKKGPSMEERLKTGLKNSVCNKCAPCLLTMGKGALRLICLASFGITGMLLGILGQAVLVSEDARRLAPTPVPPTPSWEPTAAIGDSDAGRGLQEWGSVWPPPQVCIEDGVTFGDDSVWRVVPVYKPSVCQGYCELDDLCRFFTFYPDDHICDLKGSDLKRNFHTKGISGPKYCQGTTTPPPRNESTPPTRLNIGCFPNMSKLMNQSNATANLTNGSANGMNGSNGSNGSNATNNATANDSRPNISSWYNGTPRECSFDIDVVPSRRRRSYDEFGMRVGNINLEGKALINCTDRDWCIANVTNSTGANISLARCSLPNECGGCPECWPPCVEVEDPVEAEEVEPEHPGEDGAWILWASLPARYVRYTWCSSGAMSPVAIFLLFFLVRGYAWSLSLGLAQKYEKQRHAANANEKRRKSRELGMSVRELEESKKKVKKKREPLVKISKEEDIPKETAFVNGGRIFAV